MHLNNSAEASVAGAKGSRVTAGGHEGREVMRPCRPQEDFGFCSEGGGSYGRFGAKERDI